MTELTHASFSDFVQSHRFALVHFYATWNGYDTQMKAWLEADFPMDWRDVVAIGTMDVDPPEHHRICRDHKILNLPFLAFYRDGSLVRSATGLVRGLDLLQSLNQLVSPLL